MPKQFIAGLMFECGGCEHRGIRRVKAPSPEEIARVRRRAVCSKCGSPGSIEVIWDGGWQSPDGRDQVSRLETILPGRVAAEAHPEHTVEDEARRPSGQGQIAPDDAGSGNFR